MTPRLVAHGTPTITQGALPARPDRPPRRRARPGHAAAVGADNVHAEPHAGSGLPAEPGIQGCGLLAGTHVLPGAFQHSQVGAGPGAAPAAGGGAGADHDIPGDAGQAMTVTHVAGSADPHPSSIPRIRLAKISNC